METTILLSKVLGLFIAITGLVIMVRRQYFISVVGTFIKERMTRLIMSVVELIAALFVMVTHTDFSNLPATIITIVAYVAFVESIIYMALPDKQLQKMIRKFEKPQFYVLGGSFSIIVGLYLAAFGFGFF